jgi:hypothetical protein
VDEPIKIRAEEINEGLTTAALAGVGERPVVQPDVQPVVQPEVRPVAASTVSVGSARSLGTAAAPALDETTAPLFSPEEAKDFRTRWDAIQASFVDEPRQVVEQADSLVAVAMKRLAEMFAAERTKLEGQWDRGDNVSTEELRLALRRYRSFFGRLLSV